MADKRISQLVERINIANNDVLPIVASGATTTNKVTVSTLQDWMQDNLDVGVTSVGITLGTTGTDVNITGSPVTSSGNITINLPTASATNRGLLSAADWSTFNGKANAADYVTLATAQTITGQKTFTASGGSDSVIISTSGAGFSLDAIKSGNGEVIRVNKTSGTGNAMTVIGGNFEAPTIVKTGGTSTQYLMADGSVSTLTNPVTGTGVNERVALWNGTNSINSDSDFTYNSTSNLLTLGGGITLTGAQTIQTSTGNLTLATAAGNGNIVLNAHGDGNVTTNDSIFIGSSSGVNYGGFSNKLSVATTNYNLFDITRFSNDNDGGRLYLGKSRGSTVGSNVIVQNGDLLGTIQFEGDCGEGMAPAASISAEVDGVPGLTNDMPGRLIFRTCSDNTIFAAERMRISSTGLVTLTGALNGTSGSFSGNFEIGNTSGSAINSSSGLGNLVVGNGGASSQGITIYTNSSTYGGLNFADATTGVGSYAGYIKFDHTNDSFGFFIGNSPKLTLASTGNVGIGVTPSSWFTSGGYKVLELGAGLSLDSGNDFRARIASNAFVNTSGDWAYRNAGFASNYNQTDGNHIFSNAPSGASGNAVSFVERMRITSGGNVEATGTIKTGNLASFSAQPFKVGPITNGVLVTNAYIRMEINGNPVNVLIAY
jgi:hypothetical protein